MDTTYSSGEDLLIKTRKPYTITKQRERWTEEEHSRFLEALKLYGRAWQRIEEHIGTKTAVQIRSHAQKFFSKLEKEALIKGVPLGQSLDIDIPPPRPKRKPSNPYPRKTSVDAPTSSPVGAKDGKLLESASSVYPDKQMLNLENDPPPEKASGAEKTARAKETLDEDNCSEVLVLFQESPCASISSASKNSKPAPAVPTGPCALREFVPSTKEINESCLTVETIGSQKLVGTDAGNTDLDNGISESQNLVQRERTDELKQPMKLGLSTTNEIQANQNYPRHVPVHVVDSSEMCMKTSSPDMTYPASLIHQVGGVHRNPNLFTNPTASSTTEDHSNMSRSSIHQSLPSFLPPFNPLCNIQDNYQSFLNASPTFSSLIVSSLLQNPAAHAAACLAASFLPCPNMEISVDSPATIPGGFPLRHMRPSPSMAAIAAATVAAASAWWAAHGLFPLCPPLHTGFTCTPAPSTENPSADAGQAHVINKERKINTQDSPWEDQHPGPELSEALKTQHSASKSPPLTPSDSEESGGAKSNRNGLNAVDHNQKPVPVTEFHDSNNTKTRKQVDRSSCGSNTPSSSEVEIEALEKNDEGKEESKEPDVSHPAGEPNNRRIRSSIGNINESWKEVSEGGRLAFQALFSREVLPQSFSPPHDLRNKGHLEHIEEGKQKSDKECDTTLQLDLNCKTWGTWLNLSEVQKNELLRSDNNTDKGLLMTRLGHGKFMACRTGFKPYKRCSVEAKESRVSSGSGQGEEKCPKRIRLEGEASKC